MSDFVDEQIVDFVIDGKTWKYKPATGGDENKWATEYTELDPGDPERKKSRINWGIYNMLKMLNIRAVPYTPPEIASAIGVSKDWHELSKEEKTMLLEKLKPKLLQQVVQCIRNIDEPDEEKKKN